jgi:hypothetical protein
MNICVRRNIVVTYFVEIQYVPADWFDNVRVISERIFPPLSGPNYTFAFRDAFDNNCGGRS